MAHAVHRRRKFWGWGYVCDQPTGTQLRESGAALREGLGFDAEHVREPPRLEDLSLRPAAIRPAGALESICSQASYDRATHAYGKSYRDLVRAFNRQIEHPPDVVCFPRCEADIEAVLDWCQTQRLAAIPYGGGTSVVGGVEPRVRADYNGTVSIDLQKLDRVMEIDHVSQAALIEAGATGPRIETELRPHGLTLRHYPQSFEFSTLGGWIATRSGGHFATLQTHIDDFVEALRCITCEGGWESRRLPGSGAGPSPDRLLLGSEGVLGIITKAWMRLQPRPTYRAAATVCFQSFSDGAACCKALSQSGLWPSNCRLLDADEAWLTAAGDGSASVLMLGFESSDHPLEPWLERALELCRDFGGEPTVTNPGRDGEGRGRSSWRRAFFGAPYVRDTLVCAGVLTETFESAVTWDSFDRFYDRVLSRAREAVTEACGAGRVTSRLTHLYPDGAACYFTVLAPARRGEEIRQWDAIKAAVSEIISSSGGTITHHHAVGRDHRPWYDSQRPDAFARALAAAKQTVDPQGVMNPGVLIDP